MNALRTSGRVLLLVVVIAAFVVDAARAAQIVVAEITVADRPASSVREH